MKNMTWLLGAIYAVALSATPLSAEEPRVFTVDNNGGPHADFTDLQAAMDAAEDGDVYHVLGSTIPYGNVTISKQVHLFGPGYNLARVYTEGYQSFYEATLGTVTIQPTPTTSPAGTTISGFKTSNISIHAADVTIDRNWSASIWIDVNTTYGVILEQPHRARVIRNIANSIGYSGNFPHASLDHLVANNVFTGGVSSALRNSSILHNIIGNYFDARNCVIENNIMFGFIPNSTSINNVLKHNFFRKPKPTSETFLTSNSFLENTWDLESGPVNLYDALTTNTGAFDEKFQLTEDSMAKGAGIDGVDLGPFAGPFPYEISGVPPLPRVKIMAPGPFVVSPSSDLEIPVKIILE